MPDVDLESLIETEVDTIRTMLKDRSSIIQYITSQDIDDEILRVRRIAAYRAAKGLLTNRPFTDSGMEFTPEDLIKYGILTKGDFGSERAVRKVVDLYDAIYTSEILIRAIDPNSGDLLKPEILRYEYKGEISSSYYDIERKGFSDKGVILVPFWFLKINRDKLYAVREDFRKLEEDNPFGLGLEGGVIMYVNPPEWRIRPKKFEIISVFSEDHVIVHGDSKLLSRSDMLVTGQYRVQLYKLLPEDQIRVIEERPSGPVNIPYPYVRLGGLIL